jgi:hypothetical protein
MTDEPLLREALERIVREDHEGGAGWMAEIAQAALDAGGRMTDREQIAAILDRAGVVFTTDEESGEVSYGYDKAHAYASTLTVEESHLDRTRQPLLREHTRNIGYTGFMTIFYFDPAGMLVCMGAWE